MKLTKKEICLIGMEFAMSAIAVLAIIGGSWLFKEIMFHLDRLTSDTILVTGLSHLVYGLGMLVIKKGFE